MYIINDLELLERIGKHGILRNILANNSISISSIKLNEYSFSLRKQISIYSSLTVHAGDDDFEPWFAGKRMLASIGDLNSVYIAKKENLSLVISPEDIYLGKIARDNHVLSLKFDDFIVATVKDEHMVQIYHLIKAA